MRILLSIFALLFSPVVVAQVYVEGKIITHSSDTIACQMLKLKKRAEEYQACFQAVQVQDDSGKVKTLYPVDIAGYMKQGIVYKTLRAKAADKSEMNLFIL